ncbi:MAG: replicative DNA helicase [Agriterribacter sp.]
MEFKKDIHYSPDIESAVIGACLLEKNTFGRTHDIIDPETFYSDGNQEVYKAMTEMFNNGLPIELLSVADYLMRSKGVTEIMAENVPYYLTRVSRSIVSTASLEYHCFCLREMWTKRELVKLTYGGLKEDDAKKSMGEIYERLQYIQGKAFVKDWQDMGELMIGLYKHQDKMMQVGGMGLTTGFKSIDEKTGGFFPGQMIVIGARPSVGKSALSGQMAIEIARKGHKVGIISLEMSNNEIAARIAAIDTNTDFKVLFRGLFYDDRQREAIYQKLNTSTAKLPIYISDKTNVNINEIRSKSAKLKSKHGLDILMIDYLQLVEGEKGKNIIREQQVAAISRGTKLIAKELDIPVVILCQLNREVTKRKGNERYPQLSDLRESGSIEQDADAVIFLHSDWMNGILADEHGNSTESMRDIVIRKWRNAEKDIIIPIEFDGPKMMFKEHKGFIPLPPSNMQSDNPYKNDDTPF